MAFAKIDFMNRENTIISSRVFFALLGFSAIITEVATIVERGRFIPANFFSFFTVESNLLAVVVLLLSALALSRGRENRTLALLRGANTLNMIIVGVVFSLLLSGLDTELTAVPWDNIVLHYIMPVVVALDWFACLPRSPVSFRSSLLWLIFPIAYVVYSLTRGYIVGWYPYPFLDPSQHGYLPVAVTCLVLAVVMVGLAWLLARFTGQYTKSSSRRR